MRPWSVDNVEPRAVGEGGDVPAAPIAVDTTDGARVHEPHAGCVALPPQQPDDVVRQTGRRTVARARSSW